MKEIHAYKNEDGTYRINGVSEMFNGKEFVEVDVEIKRAKISVDALADANGVICDLVIVEDNQ